MQCDCESEICENKQAHIAGSCPNPVKFKIAIYGHAQNVCASCMETSKGFFNATETSFKLIGEYK